MTGPGEDAERLAAAAQEWLARGRDAAQSLLASDGPLGAAFEHDGPECKVCPVCQGIALVRSVRPEVVQHLGEAMTSLFAALAELAQSATAASSDSAAADGSAPADEAGSRNPRAAQRIEVTGD